MIKQKKGERVQQTQTRAFGTIERCRFNRWYAAYDYLVRFEEPPPKGWPNLVWLRADELKDLS